MKKTLISLTSLFLSASAFSMEDSTQRIERKYVEKNMLPVIREIVGDHPYYKSYDSLVSIPSTGYKQGMDVFKYWESWVAIPKYKQIIDEKGLILPSVGLSAKDIFYRSYPFGEIISYLPNEEIVKLQRIDKSFYDFVIPRNFERFNWVVKKLNSKEKEDIRKLNLEIEGPQEFGFKGSGVYLIPISLKDELPIYGIDIPVTYGGYPYFGLNSSNLAYHPEKKWIGLAISYTDKHYKKYFTGKYAVYQKICPDNKYISLSDGYSFKEQQKSHINDKSQWFHVYASGCVRSEEKDLYTDLEAIFINKMKERYPRIEQSNFDKMNFSEKGLLESKKTNRTLEQSIENHKNYLTRNSTCRFWGDRGKFSGCQWYCARQWH